MPVLIVKPAPWSVDAEKGLSVSLGDDLPIIARQVINGEASLWDCKTDNGGGFVVTRIEETGVGLELVLVAGEGRGFDEFFPYLMNYCKENGLSFRTHVRRKGLLRMYQKHGVGVREFVLGFD